MYFGKHARPSGASSDIRLVDGILLRPLRKEPESPFRGSFSILYVGGLIARARVTEQGGEIDAAASTLRHAKRAAETLDNPAMAARAMDALKKIGIGQTGVQQPAAIRQDPVFGDAMRKL